MVKIILRFGAALILAGIVVQHAGATPSSAAPGQKGEQAAAKSKSNSDDHSQASTQAKQKSQEAEDKNEGEKPRHKLHFRLGTISVGAAYTHFSGGFVSPFYPYAFYPYGFSPYGALYSPFFYGPFYGPFYYPPYASGLNYSPGKGQVKLSSTGKDKSAEIYIDDAYAGTVRELKSMWLDPGAYDLSVIAADGSTFQKRIYVLSGKTMKIKAVLEPKPSPEKHQ